MPVRPVEAERVVDATRKVQTMIFSLFRPKTPDPADAVYAEIVAQARQPGFYLDCSVPDTVEGRFEMILLHLAILFHRLTSGGEAAQRVGQNVVDAFFSDMDRTLREMGIGDISVPKKMKKLGDAYNGRSLAYSRAIAERDGAALAAAVIRNVMAVDAGRETADQLAGANRIAAYVLASVDRLADQSVDAILRAEMTLAPLNTPPGDT